MAASRRALNNGFSLLELLVSIALLAVGIITVVQALSYSAGVVALSDTTLAAAALLKDELYEWEYKESAGLLGKTEKTGAETITAFELTDTLESDDELELYRLMVSVAWVRKHASENLKATTYLRAE